jgi:hypothetical protein
MERENEGMMMNPKSAKRCGGVVVGFLLLFIPLESAFPQAETPSPIFFASPDSVEDLKTVEDQQHLRNAWGLDILISDNGFGLGLFYRREFTEDLSGFVSLSVSEAKDEREVEFVDYFGNTFVPGKLNRFLVIPLSFGIQQRLFREAIVETFRPYLNIGAGPAMIYVSPFTRITKTPSGGLILEPIDFFDSLGKGSPHYTVSAFIGIGANFGADRSNLFGVNFRYYFTYLFGDGIPALYDIETGDPAKNQTSFGGFFITLNVGMMY